MVHLRVKNKTEILTSIARTKGEFRGPGSSVSIATGYGLDGPGIESRWGRDFPNLCRPALGPTSLMYNESRVFPGGKERPGCEADPSPLLVPWSRKIRAIPLLPLLAVRPVQSLSACTVQLYLFSPYGPYGLYRASVPVQYSYTSSPPMGRTACTEPQCLYKGALYILMGSIGQNSIYSLQSWIFYFIFTEKKLFWQQK